MSMRRASGVAATPGALDDRKRLAIHGFINRGEQAIDGLEVVSDQAARNLGLGADAVNGEAKDAVARQAGEARVDQHFAAGFGGLADEFGLGRRFLFYLGHGEWAALYTITPPRGYIFLNMVGFGNPSDKMTGCRLSS